VLTDTCGNSSRAPAAATSCSCLGYDRHAGNDRDRFEAVSLCAFELATQLSEIRSAFDRARRTHALIDFDHALIKHFGFDDVARKYIGTRLVTDA